MTYFGVMTTFFSMSFGWYVLSLFGALFLLYLMFQTVKNE